MNDNQDCKLVLVVRNDLKMGKGKIVAQCAHAAVAAYKTAKKYPPIIKAWENSGQVKVTVKVFPFISRITVIIFNATF